MNYDEISLRKLINDFAERNGIICGVCDCSRLFTCDKDELKNTPFVTPEIERRLEPKLTRPGAKSIIVVGLGYKKACKKPDDGVLRGKISQSAVGIDYHVVMMKILEALADLLRSHVELEYTLSVDTGALVERSLAVSAGLGFVGKNRSVVSKKFGSYFNIGYMITDLCLTPDTPSSGGCPAGCDLCITACPGSALTEKTGYPCAFDYQKCLSYLTQKKSDLSAWEKKLIGNRVYGCDTCLDVCPLNENAEFTDFDDAFAMYPDLDRLIDMTKGEFKAAFGSTAIYWRGKKTILRNAVIAKENLLSR